MMLILEEDDFIVIKQKVKILIYVSIIIFIFKEKLIIILMGFINLIDTSIVHLFLSNLIL